MTRIEEIRSAVEALSTLSDDEWEKIDKIISNQPKLKEETKVDANKISYVEKEKKVTELLKMLGMPSHLKGYYYTRKAVLLLIDDREKYLSGVTKVLYPTIAKEFKTTSSKVERAIRHAAETTWEIGNIEIQDKIFGYSVSAKTGKPTNSELVTCIADYVKMYVL